MWQHRPYVITASNFHNPYESFTIPHTPHRMFSWRPAQALRELHDTPVLPLRCNNSYLRTCTARTTQQLTAPLWVNPPVRVHVTKAFHCKERKPLRFDMKGFLSIHKKSNFSITFESPDVDGLTVRLILHDLCWDDDTPPPFPSSRLVSSVASSILLCSFNKLSGQDFIKTQLPLNLPWKS